MFNSLLNPQLLDFELKNDEIHIWNAALDQPASQIQRLIQTLSIDERVRAKRLRFEADRKRFIVGRGILRNILCGYLSIEPSRLRLNYGNHGKPAIVDNQGREMIQFNLSHSGGLALYAFTRVHAIGVDIEQIHDIPDMEQIAEHFFSVRENSVFRALPESKKREAFFNCWTRKEAFIKALGDGLSWPLDKFDVSLVPGEPARLLRIEGYSKGASRWSIQELNPAFGFAAALAVEGQSWRLHCWQWSDQAINKSQFKPNHQSAESVL